MRPAATRPGDHARDVALTLAGVLVLSPDALLLRLISADPWTILFGGGLRPRRGARGLDGDPPRPRRAPAPAGPMGGRARRGALVALATTCFVTAVTRTAVADVVVLYSTAPLFAVVFSRLVLRERVPWHTGIAVLLGVLAVVLTLGGGGAGAARTGTSLLGDLAALRAVPSAGALVLVILRRRCREADPTPTLALAGLMVAGLALPAAAPLAVSAADAGWLLVLCLVVIPLSFALVTIGPRHLPAPEVALIMMLELVLAPLWVWLVLGEPPSAGAACGGLLLLATLAGNTLLGARGARSAATEEDRIDDRAVTA